MLLLYCIMTSYSYQKAIMKILEYVHDNGNCFRSDGEMARASDYHKLIWKDMIHAVLHEVPKLKIHVKVKSLLFF